MNADVRLPLNALLAIFCKGTSVLPGPFAYDTREDFSRDRSRATKDALRDAVELDEARRRLLATGFDVPDAWLTVNPIISVDFHNDREGNRWIRYAVEDRQATRKVYREICAAIMRLDAKTQSTPYLGLQVHRDSRVIRRDGCKHEIHLLRQPLLWHIFTKLFDAGDEGSTKDAVLHRYPGETSAIHQARSQLNRSLSRIQVRIQPGKWRLINTSDGS